MANRVHTLIRPLVPLRKALVNVKSAGARAADAVLGRTGEPFWQSESYDHWVRTGQERNSVIRYIEFNPVTAGLVSQPQEWRWSSAGWPRMAEPHKH
jgi:type I restriction enzyme R subunit/putative DNA methylase